MIINLTDLSEVQLCKVRALLDRYGHSVSRSDLDLGLTGTVQHKIDVQGSEPVKQRYHRVLGPLKHEVEEQLGELERKGIIEQSDSPWSSPLVPVRKKNGQVRICLDYRLLNDRSRLDSFPLPNMVDMLSALSGATYFSTLDLSKGFYQIELEPESRPYTAFSTGGSHYQFRVMPFGLANAPATAQRLISFVLAGLSWDVAMAYIDDILVTGANFDEHLKNLETVLSRLVDHGLKVKPQKCSLFRRKVEYLGHLVSSAGIEPSPAGIEAIMKFPMPRTVRQVRSFLGMVNFFRRHIPKCSQIMAPLTDATKGKNLKWTEDCLNAFESLKIALTTPPVLAYPQFTELSNKLTVTADASLLGAGAVLTQVQEGIEKVIAYASTTFTTAERNYSTTDRELAALRWAVKHFRPFLSGRAYVIRSDHRPLIYLANMKKVDSRLLRTFEDLNVGHYELQYIPGKDNVVADSLSRAIDLSDLVEETDETFAVQRDEKYVTVPGGADSLFMCLSLVLFDSMDHHLFIRKEVLERVMKSPEDFGIVSSRVSRRNLKAMLHPGVLPCAEALPAFVALYDMGFKVHVDRLGVVDFPSASGRVGAHLHLIGGVHFNLLARGDCRRQADSPASASGKIIYMLEDDSRENKIETTVMQIRPKIERPPAEASKSEARGVSGSGSGASSTDASEIINLTHSDLDYEEIKEYQRQDLELMKIYTAVAKKIAVNWDAQSPVQLKYGKLQQVSKELCIREDVLCCQTRQGAMPIIPTALLKPLLMRMHADANHLGREKFVVLVRGYYYHPDLLRVARRLVKECDICQRFKVYSRGGQPVIQRSAASPLDQYALDVLQVDQAAYGLKYLVVGIDTASRFVHAVPLRDKTATTVTRAVEERIFPALPRMPVSVLTDNGTEFTGKVFSNLLAKYGIKHHTSVPYLGHTNGRVERMNRNLLVSLATACRENGTTWPEQLPRVLININHAKHRTTGKAPVDFFTGGTARLPLPSKQRWKHETSRFRPFALGDLVAWKLPAYQTQNKLAPRYSAPHKVVRVYGQGLVYDILDEHGVSRRGHYEQLKAWYGPWRGDDVRKQAADISCEPAIGMREGSPPTAESSSVPTAAPAPLAELGDTRPAWMRALANGFQTFLPGWLQTAAQRAQLEAAAHVERDREQAEVMVAVPSASGLQYKTGAIPKNPRRPSQPQPAVTTRAMSKRLDFWSIDPDSIDEQLPLAAQDSVAEGFERFDGEREVLASTPLRRIRAVLNRTVLDPSSDCSDDDWDGELRDASGNEPDDLVEGSEGL